MEHIKEIIKNRKDNSITSCPQCGKEARRILEDGRYYIRCTWCGYDNLARFVASKNSIKEELDYIYGDK